MTTLGTGLIGDGLIGNPAYGAVEEDDLDTDYAAIDFRWGGMTYTKSDLVPAMSVSQRRHAKARGYVQEAATLTVIRPFSHHGVTYTIEDAAPSGLTDAQTRRLISGRYMG